LSQVGGVLVGGASLLTPDFTSICNYKIWADKINNAVMKEFWYGNS
jgi:hypothetical protein